MLHDHQNRNTMTFDSTITEYWAEQFPVAPQSPAAVGCAVKPDFDDDYRVMIMERPDREIRAIVTPEIASQLALKSDENCTLAQFRQRLTDIGIQLHGADFLFYFPQTAHAGLQTAPQHPAVRRLTQGDAERFGAFEMAADEADLDGVSVGLDDWIALAAFESGCLVAAASMYPWDAAPLADVRVLTLPAFRRKGLAAALIRACAAQALSRGLQRQYRCQTDNAGRRRWPHRSGFPCLAHGRPKRRKIRHIRQNFTRLNFLKKVLRLYFFKHQAIDGEDGDQVRAELRKLIDRVDFIPMEGLGKLQLEVHGSLAALLAMGQAQKAENPQGEPVGYLGCGSRIWAIPHTYDPLLSVINYASRVSLPIRGSDIPCPPVSKQPARQRSKPPPEVKVRSYHAPLPCSRHVWVRCDHGKTT